MIKIIRDEIIMQELEQHFEVEINGKRVFVSKYSKLDEFGIEGDTEIFKDKNKLSEDEQEEVIDFVNENSELTKHN